MRPSSKWCGIGVWIALFPVLSGGLATATSMPLGLSSQSAVETFENHIAQQAKTDCPPEAEAIIGEPAQQVAWYETESHYIAICRTLAGDPYYHGAPKPGSTQTVNDVTLPAYRNGRGFSATTKALTYTINDTELLITQVGRTLVREPIVSITDQQTTQDTIEAEETAPRFQREIARQPANWTLNFDADIKSKNPITFNVDLSKTNKTADRRATLAQGKDIGSLQLIHNGRRLDLDAYQWTVDDRSRAYIGKSGYKYLLVIYNYGRVEPNDYKLQMVCQTRANEAGLATCQLSDNGPLLNRDLVSQGQLEFGPATHQTSAWSRRESVPDRSTKTKVGSLQNIAPETTPDRDLEQAILDQFSEQDQASQTFRYVYNRADLNGDGNPEVLTYLEQSSFCEGQRCPLLVFSPQSSGYRLLTRLSRVAPPVIVNDSKTWGWQDLVITEVETSGKSRYRRLRYTGKQYPQSLSAAEDLSPNRVSGTAFLSDRDQTLQQRDIAPARSQTSEREDNRQATFQGQGMLRVYPSVSQKTEQLFAVKQFQVDGVKPTQLLLTVENPQRTVQVRGERTVSSDEGYRLRINAIDNQPAQGTLFVGSDGSLRTLAPIFMGANDQELSLNFRAN